MPFLRVIGLSNLGIVIRANSIPSCSQVAGAGVLPPPRPAPTPLLLKIEAGGATFKENETLFDPALFDSLLEVLGVRRALVAV